MSTYVPKGSRDDIYRFFFTEGVIACKKDRLGNWTGLLGDSKIVAPCLHVMQLMRSLKSRNLIKEKFAWRHYYWTLNAEGIQYMREYLHLPASAVPKTQKPTDVVYQKMRERGRGRGRGEGRGRETDIFQFLICILFIIIKIIIKTRFMGPMSGSWSAMRVNTDSCGERIAHPDSFSSYR
eukprot:gene4926-3537_t